MRLFVFGHANEGYMDKCLIHIEHTIMCTFVITLHSRRKYIVHKISFYWKHKDNFYLFFNMNLSCLKTINFKYFNYNKILCYLYLLVHNLNLYLEIYKI